MQDLINDFLAQKRIAIVGVTRDPKGWGRAMYDAFKSRGYDTYAVNPARAIAGLQCYGKLSDLPMKVDGVLLAVSPKVTDEVVRQVAELGIPRVWMHRGVGGEGAVSQDAIKYCQENQIAVIYGVCPLMYLKPTGFGHKLHHAFAKWRKQLPEDA
ncbi:MAG: CoA-binding protein [Chloroflexi bacterium]|nr:CoA-binding protein [Chloroflexota bacterium]